MKIDIDLIGWDNGGIERKVAKEALLAAFDMLGDDDNTGIFCDQYGIVLKDNPGQIILEVEREDDYICYIWQAGQWHDVEGRA